MSFLEDFQASLEPLPNILQRKYALLRDLDKSLQGLGNPLDSPSRLGFELRRLNNHLMRWTKPTKRGVSDMCADIQRQNEHRCLQEIEDFKQGLKSGTIAPDSSFLKFSDEALDEQKHTVRIADEKVALAVQAYDLVDAHIQQLDQYLKKYEERRRERDNATASGSPAPNPEGNGKSGRGGEGSRGGRKKTRLAAAAAANPPSMDLDLPVDPNEPTYCFCNQVSYGEMVACDNPDCKIEWFHYGCVGLKEQPKGKWFCSECNGMPKRRKGK